VVLVVIAVQDREGRPGQLRAKFPDPPGYGGIGGREREHLDVLLLSHARIDALVGHVDGEDSRRRRDAPEQMGEVKGRAAGPGSGLDRQ
jgi:hypothetical protein